MHYAACIALPTHYSLLEALHQLATASAGSIEFAAAFNSLFKPKCRILVITNDQKKSALMSEYQFLLLLAYSTCSHVVVMHWVLQTADPANAHLLWLGEDWCLCTKGAHLVKEVGTEHMSVKLTVLLLM